MAGSRVMVVTICSWVFRSCLARRRPARAPKSAPNAVVMATWMIAGSGMWALGAASKKMPWAIRIQSPNSDPPRMPRRSSGAGSVVLETSDVGAG